MVSTTSGLLFIHRAYLVSEQRDACKSLAFEISTSLYHSSGLQDLHAEALSPVTQKEAVGREKMGWAGMGGQC